MMRFALRLLGALGLLAVSSSVIACGDPGSSTPSPEVIATAESVARTVTFGARSSVTPEKDDDDDNPIVLDGRVFGNGPTGVILAHMRLGDQTSWFPFATMLAQSGKYTVLTFNFRGFGESTGDKEFGKIDADLEAAVDYMRQTLTRDKVFIVGASMGGTAALVLGSRVNVDGIVTISAPAQFPPLDATESVKDARSPKLFITSKDDVPQARAQAEFWESAPEPKQQYIYDGDDHGMELFDGPFADDLKRRILGFLDNPG